MSDEKLYVSGWKDYELIDAGGGKKLERWGSIITIRPELQAYFRSGKPFDEWRKMAHWEFIEKGGKTGTWKSLKNNAPREWKIKYKNLTFKLKLTKFKHVGLFPEQRINWDFIDQRLGSDSKFLNLFAYTGAASIVSRNKGAETTHVDSVKQLISWAKENMELSELMNIKWVHEDALKFTQREVKRERSYDGIIMDPPAWGIGAKKEKWKLEDKLEELIRNAATLIGRKGFLILNTYSPQVKIEFLEELANRHLKKRGPVVQELWMKTTTGKELFYGNVLRVG
ncbi:MAG: class I SAM-dependent methyltransferase [Crocinitomicaceae bacterium]|nr:class I SAM-dependent methyltransferase [Flavobacteriales bacterium]NQZ36206.1 class I SAM-dependent methyltransferase [Crocinitomicaceae bacterium]